MIVPSPEHPARPSGPLDSDDSQLSTETERRRRPTTSLVVMFILGTLWCWFLVWMGRGATTDEPWDRGWVAGWVFQYLLVGTLLLHFWWLRASAWVIVLAPIAIQLLALALLWAATDALQIEVKNDTYDDATFLDAFIQSVVTVGIATAVVGWICSALMARAQR